MAEQAYGDFKDETAFNLNPNNPKITTLDVLDDGRIQTSAVGHRGFYARYRAYIPLPVALAVALAVVVVAAVFSRFHRQEQGDVDDSDEEHWSYVKPTPMLPFLVLLIVGIALVVVVLKFLTARNEDAENQDFGRDTNRIDYFRFTPLDVRYVGESEGSSSYGGGTVTSYRQGKDGIQSFEQETLTVGAGASERSNLGEEGEAVRRPWWKKSWFRFTNKFMNSYPE